MPRKLSEIAPTALATLPAVVDAEGVKVAIAESDVEDYPGLWLRGTGGAGITARIPALPTEGKPRAGPRLSELPRRPTTSRSTRGTRTYPWRVMGIADEGWRPDHQPDGLAAGKAVAGAGHLVDQARQGGVGLVEREQRLRRGLPSRGQYPRLTSTTSTSRPNTGWITSSWTKAGTSWETCSTWFPKSTCPELVAYGRQKECRHHLVGGMEDVGRPVDSRRWTSSASGALRASRSISCSATTRW